MKASFSSPLDMLRIERQFSYPSLIGLRSLTLLQVQENVVPASLIVIPLATV